VVWDSGHKQIGYSSKWLEYDNRNNLEHYIEKYKEHEANATSTNERNQYWKNYKVNLTR
jgi:hypothetical protein